MAGRSRGAVARGAHHGRVGQGGVPDAGERIGRDPHADVRLAPVVGSRVQRRVGLVVVVGQGTVQRCRALLPAQRGAEPGPPVTRGGDPAQQR